MAREIGLDLAAAGIDLNYAPVADVTPVTRPLPRPALLLLVPDPCDASPRSPMKLTVAIEAARQGA